MDNIIYYLEPHALGDDIHIHRNVLLDILDKNLITDEIVIYCLADRRFLYSNIFKNIIVYKDIPNLDETKSICDSKFGKNFIIIKNSDLYYTIWEVWQEIKKHGRLDIDISITKSNFLNFNKINYYNNLNYSSRFKSLVTNINYLENIPRFCNDKYIVYHHRFKSDNLWDGNDEILEAILKYSEDYNIVLFTQKELNFNNSKIYTTSNLQEYVTYINNENCLAVISVWSGGGQIASYCSSNKLLMYFHPMQAQYNISNDQLDHYIKSENSFDFCQFTDVDRKFLNIDEIIYNLKAYI
jgi:hypothetical protein